jgi:hypothetical protein
VWSDFGDCQTLSARAHGEGTMTVHILGLKVRKSSANIHALEMINLGEHCSKLLGQWIYVN